MTHKRLAAVHKSPPAHWVGDGFHVQPLFGPLAFGQEVSPFLMLDYAAPHDFPPRRKPPGVGVHPHRGFETVTIVYDGEVEHRDSAGNSGTIGPGDVQWMTAGAGVLHEEFHSRDHAARGGTVSMAQLWVNLPARHKRVAPAYQTLQAAEIPVVPVAGGKGEMRVVAGRWNEAAGPAHTFTPLNVWDVTLEAGADLSLDIPAGHNVMLALLTGAIAIDGAEVAGASLLTFDEAGNSVSLRATTSSKLLVLTGEPLNEPIAHYGPFVMNTEAEIHESIAAFRRGEMGEIEEMA